MKITFLGTGTSNGVPYIACSCPVCASTNPKNKRLRSSVYLQDQNASVLIDAASDFRQQALANKIKDLDHILITHIHADHVFGLDEMRRFNQLYKKPLQVYLKPEFDAEIRQVFRYIYEEQLQRGGGVSQLINQQILPYQTFLIGDLKITPLLVNHGVLAIYGYRINNFAYITDASAIPEKTYQYLQNLDVLVLNALRDSKHPTHFSLDEAVLEAQKIGAKQTWLTHIAHNLEHESTNQKLPKNIQLAYDGLVLEI